MFVIFNKDGSIFAKTQSDYVMQGSNRVNKVFVGFVDNDYADWTCNGVFNLPNGTRWTIPAIYVAGGFQYLGTTYFGWQIELTDDITKYFGNVELSIQIVNSQTSILYTYLTNITVNRTGYPIDGSWDASINVAQFNEYMAQLATKLQANTVSVAIRESDLPSTGEKNVLYFVIGATSNEPYQVKMWNGSEYTLLGTVNLSTYANKEDISQLRNEIANPFVVVSTTQDLPSTDQHKLYIVQADNKWYYWNGNEYVDGGVFIDSGTTIENLEGQFSELGQALYDYIETRFNNGDHRPFTMSVESIQDWQGNQYQDEPLGNVFGWYDEFNGYVVIVASVGIFVLQADYITVPRIEDIVLAVDVNYDNTNSSLTSKNVKGAIDELATTKANKDGYYQQMRVGLADNVVSPDGIKQDATFALRPTGGTASITDGFAEIKEIKGRTLIVNQLQKISTQPTFTDAETGLTITNNNDGTITISGTILATKAGSITITKGVDLGTYNNKVYLTNLNNSSPYLSFRIAGQNNATFAEGVSSKIWAGTADRPNNSTLCMAVVGGVGETINITIKPITTDLTKMFGAGDEPATIAEFNNLTRFIDVETYNEGTPINNEADEIVSVGFNAFDGELELGGISTATGIAYADASNIRSKNDIAVDCGKTYTFTLVDYPTKNIIVYEYDKDRNYIGWVAVQGSSTNKSIKLKDNTCYIKVMTSLTDINTKLCIHITHSGYRNGQFEPYWKETRKLPTLAYFPEGMKSAGEAYDSLTPTKARKVIGSVNLGTLNWRYISSNGRMVSDGLYGIIKTHSGYVVKPNILCIKYSTDTPQALEGASPTNMTISIGGNGTDILIYDNAYTDTTAFKQSLSGVILYFELAEPIETDITDSRANDWFYRVSDFGTEGANKFISAKIFYMNNLRDKLRNLPDIPECEDTTGTSVLKCINGTYIWVKEE